MKTFFEIIPETFDSKECSLVCEISDEGVSFCIKDIRENRFLGIAVYNFEKKRPSEGFPIALQILFTTKPFLTNNFKKTIVVFSLPESTLVPFQLFNRNAARETLNLLFGQRFTDYTELTDLVTESGYYNFFRVRNGVLKIIDQHFPDKLSWHQYSVLIGRHSSEENRMFVIFYSYKMVVSLFVNAKCRLINTYHYKFAEDASYYLLAICEQNNAENISLEVSGFIEKESSLYLELYKYFKNIEFAPLPDFCEYSEELKQYPAHYFSRLYELDPCG